MVNFIKFHVAKTLGKLSFPVLKVLPTGGKSFPGLLYLNIAGKEALGDLSNHQLDMGSILITGTNGKTTTTTMIIKILSNDFKLATSVGNNTIYALTTGLLNNKAELGVFEYGIRDIVHGTPDLICNQVQPIGVVYTNISREHTQVAGVKNPFEDYVKAKTLLSETMHDGILITNADDPNTTFIGLNKEKDNHVVYYGLELDEYEDIFEEGNVSCPNCGKNLEYTRNYFNQRGIYNCSCGFKRPDPDVKLTKLIQDDKNYYITIEVDVYNYHKKDNIRYTLDMQLPIVGIHNLYNCLATIATYTAFTNNENIKENVLQFFKNYEFVIPPGRFEVLRIGDKTIGVGQGDNGDALKVNSLLMKNYVDGELEFIYTTPDVNEEEIFEDHCLSIKGLNPDKLIIMPGRVSTEVSEEYYNQIKDQFNSEYCPVEFDFEKRINKVLDLIQNSQYKYIIISGCGEEIIFWDELKKKIRELNS
ncbi:MAG: UDP-N-acetylmuramyl peptide synthase [Methanosphaera stadtmanae]|nr:UDP-N-acetylmuramyl peptide synthase [Methanosphaera stadtmanae]